MCAVFRFSQCVLSKLTPPLHVQFTLFYHITPLRTDKKDVKWYSFWNETIKGATYFKSNWLLHVTKKVGDCSQICHHGVTLVNLQRQLATTRCCAKNHSSVTPRSGRFFAIFAVLQRLESFWKRFKSVTCLQIRAKNMRCESALQVDQCNITFRPSYTGVRCIQTEGTFFWDYSVYSISGIDRTCVLLGAIPIPEWTECYSVHSAPDSRMDGIVFWRENSASAPVSFDHVSYSVFGIARDLFYWERIFCVFCYSYSEIGING